MPATSRAVENATKTTTVRCACSSTAGARKLQSCQSTTGRASASPAARLTFTDVRNGSATPSVIGRAIRSGNGWLSQWINRWWNTNAIVKPTTSAPSETKIRARSSSRCSTSVASSPWRRRRGSDFIR